MLGECQQGRTSIIRKEHITDWAGWKPLCAVYQFSILMLRKMRMTRVCQGRLRNVVDKAQGLDREGKGIR